MINDYAVLAAVQPAGSGIAPLSAAPQGIGAVGLPASWCVGAVGFMRPRLADLGVDQVTPVATKKPVATKNPGTTTIRSNDNHMTRVSANGDGEWGPQPLREQPPA